MITKYTFLFETKCNTTRITRFGVFFPQDLFRSTLKPVKQVLKDGDMKASDIDEIILVGGSTRIPKIQQLVKEFFGGKVKIEFIVNLHTYTYIPEKRIVYF